MMQRGRPMTPTEKGVLIAGSTLVGLPFAILGRGGQLAFWAWKLRPVAIPATFGVGMDPIVPNGLDFLSPGGGGPGSSPISTDTPLSLDEYGRAMAEPAFIGPTGSEMSTSSRSSGWNRRRGRRWKK